MFKKISIGLAVIAAAASGAYLLFIRPWHLRWGATDEEVLRVLPGDDLTPHPYHVSTRAITIKASAAAIWPWLVQVGYKRGGWYSYDVVERALFSGDYVEGHSANHIHPELQHVQLGDLVPFGPGTAFPVTAMEPGHYLVIGTSWAFVLDHIDAQSTRLIIRTRDMGMIRQIIRVQSLFLNTFLSILDTVLGYVLFEPLHFAMERKMLLGIKQRAERANGQTPERIEATTDNQSPEDEPVPQSAH